VVEEGSKIRQKSKAKEKILERNAVYLLENVQYREEFGGESYGDRGGQIV